MRYRLARKARSDLAAIWQYTRDTWSAEQADRYLDTLYARFLWLTKNRTLWRPRNDIGEGLYSCSEGSHVVIFQEGNDGFEIVRILHGRMDIKRHIS